MLLEPPPCAHCGQPMTQRNIGEPEDYECKPCWFTVGPLSWMRGGKGKGAMLLFSFSHYSKEGPKYTLDELPHMAELVAWVEKYVVED